MDERQSGESYHNHNITYRAQPKMKKRSGCCSATPDIRRVSEDIASTSSSGSARRSPDALPIEGAGTLCTKPRRETDQPTLQRSLLPDNRCCDSSCSSAERSYMDNYVRSAGRRGSEGVNASTSTSNPFAFVLDDDDTVEVNNFRHEGEPRTPKNRRSTPFLPNGIAKITDAPLKCDRIQKSLIRQDKLSFN